MYSSSKRTVLTSDVAEDESQPTLEVMARSTVYNAGETKAIYCRARNIPLEDINWYNQSGARVPEHGFNTRINVERKIREGNLLVPLIIRAIEINDRGNWTCVAHGLNQTINIIVGIKVNITNRNESLDGDENTKIKLNCEAFGIPDPVVHWYRAGKLIDERDKKYAITFAKKTHNHILEIRNLGPNDVGEYTCVVKQKALSHYTDKTVYLNVKHRPVFYDPDTSIITTTTSVVEVYALLDKIKNISCIVAANPAPIFKWYKRINGFDSDITDDSVVTSSDDRISVLQLRVYNESYLGEYKCSASNNKGERSIIFDVQLAQAPQPPSYVEFVSSNATSISFNVSCCIAQNVTSKGGQILEISGYKLHLVPYVEDMFPNWDSSFEFIFEIDEDDGNYTLITADNLPNTTTFTGRICSINDAGDSEWINLPFNPNTTDHGVALYSSLLLIILALIVVRY